MHNFHFRLLPTEGGDTIRVQASAIHHIIDRKIIRRAIDDHVIAVAAHPGHLGIGDDVAIAFLNARGQTLADLRIVHNAGFGHMNRFDPGGMGLDFLEVLALDKGTAYAILLPPFIDALQRRQLGFASGHNDFATNLVLNPFGGTKCLHGLFAGAAVDGLERARLIVNARMQYPGIMPRLVLCQLRFLFEHHNAALGKPLGQVVSRRQPYDPTTNDGHLSLLHSLPFLSSLIEVSLALCLASWSQCSILHDPPHAPHLSEQLYTGVYRIMLCPRPDKHSPWGTPRASVPRGVKWNYCSFSRFLMLD